MTFKQSVSTCFNKYITISGRASRSEFWYFQLFLIIAGSIAGFLDALVLDYNSAYSPLSSAFALITFIPSITVTTRRLHDINKSGWLQLWMTLVMLGSVLLTFWVAVEYMFFISEAVMYSGSDTVSIGITVMVLFGIGPSAGVWLYWLTRKSDGYTNRFGPPPWETENL